MAQNMFYRSIYVAERHMVSKSSSILTFNFISFLWLWRVKLASFESWGQVQTVLGSTNIVQQLLFSFDKLKVVSRSQNQELTIWF